MAKIYSLPKGRQKREASGKKEDAPMQKAVGVYNRPHRKGPSRAITLALVIAVVLILALFLIRFARGGI